MQTQLATLSPCDYLGAEGAVSDGGGHIHQEGSLVRASRGWALAVFVVEQKPDSQLWRQNLAHTVRVTDSWGAWRRGGRPAPPIAVAAVCSPACLQRGSDGENQDLERSEWASAPGGQGRPRGARSRPAARAVNLPG